MSLLLPFFLEVCILYYHHLCMTLNLGPPLLKNDNLIGLLFQVYYFLRVLFYKRQDLFY